MWNKKVFGFSLYTLFYYFLIFSFLGTIIEMLYCIATLKVIESRQGLLFMPICPVYGVGGVVMTVGLKKFSHSKVKLFFGGMILASTVEYITSYLLAKFLHVEIWNYSDWPLNINGRVCLFYSIVWALLAIFLFMELLPRTDKLIALIPQKIKMQLVNIIFVAVLLDAMISTYGVFIYSYSGSNLEISGSIMNSGSQRAFDHVNDLFKKYIITPNRMMRVYPQMKII